MRRRRCSNFSSSDACETLPEMRLSGRGVTFALAWSMSASLSTSAIAQVPGAALPSSVDSAHAEAISRPQAELRRARDQPRRAKATPLERTFSAADAARVDRVLKLIQQGLDRAPEVAAARWKSMTRIEDSDGEQRAIDSTRAQAARLGLDPDLAAQFQRAQIDAGKAIQAARHRQWALEGAAAPARTSDRAASVIVYQAPAPVPAFNTEALRALREAALVLRRAGGRRLLDARAADLIQIGGADLLASQVALKPLYDIAH